MCPFHHNKFNYVTDSLNTFFFVHTQIGSYKYFNLYRKETLNLDTLEVQLKACLCRIAFSKAKVMIYHRESIRCYLLQEASWQLQSNLMHFVSSLPAVSLGPVTTHSGD